MYRILLLGLVVLICNACAGGKKKFSNQEQIVEVCDYYTIYKYERELDSILKVVDYKWMVIYALGNMIDTSDYHLISEESFKYGQKALWRFDDSKEKYRTNPIPKRDIIAEVSSYDYQIKMNTDLTLAIAKNQKSIFYLMKEQDEWKIFNYKGNTDDMYFDVSPFYPDSPPSVLDFRSTNN